MYQNYYPQQQTTQIPRYATASSVGLKGRPVSSIEEVRAQTIDFDGSVFYFPDLANKRIYTKQINLDGTATLCLYEVKELPVPDNVNFITRQEFEQALQELRAALVPPAPMPAPVPTPAPSKTAKELKF